MTVVLGHARMKILSFSAFHYHIPASPTPNIFGGSAVARSVERATPGEEVPGSIPAVAARSLPAETEVMVSPLCLMCGST